MKKLSYYFFLLTVLAGVASCEKNTETTQSQLSGELRHVSITAGSAQTKTSVSGGALTWSANDKLNIVPQTGSVPAASLDITSGVGLSTGSFQGLIDASITDNTDLYGWCGGSWTYSSGTFSVNMPSTQTYVDNGLAENAYPSIGTGSITNGISLSNPMGVLKLTVKGETTESVKSITVTSTANNLAGSFTVDPSSSYAVSGGSSKTLTLNVASPYVALSSTGVNFYVVVPPAEYAANDLTVTVTFSDDSYLDNSFADAVTVTANNATQKEISISSDKTGRRGKLNDQEYVLIKAKYDGTNDSYLKWATQNLAVTESGKAKWNGTDYVIGDYFQWATYEGYSTGSNHTDLVIYSSFTINGSSGSFSGWKDSKDFNLNTSPYYNGSAYTKYTSGSATLEQSDDVARIVLGSTWRIPTGGNAGEVQAMRATTYWAWDAVDKGCYVFKPGIGTSGAAGSYGTVGTGDDKTKALLFFPAAGAGSVKEFSQLGTIGFFWSSVLYSTNTEFAHRFFIRSTDVSVSDFSYRFFGCSIRPVSD